MKKDSWLYSDSFLKRAFAIWGYNFVASIIIMIPFYILAIVIALVIGLAVGNMENRESAPSAAISEQDLQLDDVDLSDFEAELDQLDLFNDRSN